MVKFNSWLTAWIKPYKWFMVKFNSRLTAWIKPYQIPKIVQSTPANHSDKAMAPTRYSAWYFLRSANYILNAAHWAQPVNGLFADQLNRTDDHLQGRDTFQWFVCTTFQCIKVTGSARWTACSGWLETPFSATCPMASSFTIQLVHIATSSISSLMHSSIQQLASSGDVLLGTCACR